jgi:hypothetical protein
LHPAYINMRWHLNLTNIPVIPFNTLNNCYCFFITQEPSKTVWCNNNKPWWWWNIDDIIDDDDDNDDVNSDDDDNGAISYLNSGLSFITTPKLLFVTQCYLHNLSLQHRQIMYVSLIKKTPIQLFTCHIYLTVYMSHSWHDAMGTVGIGDMPTHVTQGRP